MENKGDRHDNTTLREEHTEIDDLLILLARQRNLLKIEDRFQKYAQSISNAHIISEIF